MLGDSITLTVDAVAKTLKKIIAPNPLSTMYLLREATGEYRLEIRHSDEKALIRGEKMQRHNVQLTYTFYGTTPDDGYAVIISTTIRNPERAVATEVDQISDALADFVKANGVLLVGFES